jgi:ribonuclease P protein component
VATRAATFTKAQRLLKPAEFKHVFDQRQSQHNALFGVYTARNTLNHARVGLVVSKKVSKRAVVRNKIKRLVRESFRLQQAALGSIDFVIVAKTPLADVATDTITTTLQPLWSKAIKRCKP